MNVVPMLLIQNISNPKGYIGNGENISEIHYRGLDLQAKKVLQ
jgi:hypothetical protein